jgi:hypothetical protein
VSHAKKIEKRRHWTFDKRFLAFRRTTCANAQIQETDFLYLSTRKQIIDSGGQIFLTIDETSNFLEEAQMQEA